MSAMWHQLRDALAQHPREVCCLIAAHLAQCVWEEDREWSLAAAWAIGAARDKVRGMGGEDDAADAAYAATAAYDAAATAAYAAYAATAAYAANRSDWYAYALSLLPPPGNWGPWREFHGLAVAGDYLVRLDAETGDMLPVRREALTEAELVALDGLLSEAA